MQMIFVKAQYSLREEFDGYINNCKSMFSKNCAFDSESFYCPLHAYFADNSKYFALPETRYRVQLMCSLDLPSSLDSQAQLAVVPYKEGCGLF